jgi:TetR/AcrR family transcriptional regulator, transcriptional repressor for nem operon
MPWPKDHKTRTRARIVEAAAAAFRARGVAGVRVEDVMAAAGLTHGGFYAHFASKDELLAEALELAGGQTIDTLSRYSGPNGPGLGAVIDAYLSPGHAAHPDRGCPVAALGPEVARAEGRPRRDLARGVKRRIAWMRGLLPPRRGGARGEQEQEEQVIGALACMIGGLILARTAGEKESAPILEACRRFLHRAIEEPAARQTPPGPAAARAARGSGTAVR